MRTLIQIKVICDSLKIIPVSHNMVAEPLQILRIHYIPVSEIQDAPYEAMDGRVWNDNRLLLRVLLATLYNCHIELIGRDFIEQVCEVRQIPIPYQVNDSAGLKFL